MGRKHHNKRRSQKKKPMTKKLGFCFLIYDRIKLEEIWHRFFQNVNPEKYGIYIHYKTMNPSLQYFEHCKLDNCIETEYATVSLVHAHNLLFTKHIKMVVIKSSA